MKKLLILVLCIGLVTLVIDHQTDSSPASHLVISGPFEYYGQDLSADGYLYSRLGVTESLTALSPQGQVRPLLAERWQQSADGRTWQLFIRRNVHFQDGSLLDAQAVRSSLERARQKPGIIRKVPIDSLSVDGNSLIVHLSEPYMPLLSVFAHYSLGIVSPTSFDDSGNVRQLIATGPYRIQQLAPPHKIDVVSNPDYWGKKASIEQISYLAGHRSESRALLVGSGQADIAYSIDPASRASLKRASDVILNTYALPRTILLKLNNAHPLLSSKETRQALSLALDRKGIAEAILQAPGSEAYQLFSPTQSDWYLTSFSRDRDLEKAKMLMRQQGWSYNQDGWLVRDGHIFSVNLVTYADRPELPVLATAIQNQLAQLGVQVQVQIDNSSAIPVRHHDNSLEMALIARNFGMAGSPLPILYDDFSSPHGSDWGHMNWDSPQICRTLAMMIGENEPTLMKQQSQQIARILADELPVIPVVYSSQSVAVNRRVGGFSFDPFEIDYHTAGMTINE